MTTTEDIEKQVRLYYGTCLRSYVPSDKSNDVDGLILTPELVRDKVVLDLGCCYPNDALKFGEYSKSWIAIDFCPEVIEANKTLPNPKQVEYRLMNMRKLEFEDSTFDVVLDMSSGDHQNWEGFEECARETYRVLKPKGIFICVYATTRPGEDKEWHGFRGFGYTRWSFPEEMRPLIKKIGFDIIREEGLDINVTNRAGLVGVKG